MAPPACAITVDTATGSHVNFALPTPSRIPATGRTETGSMSDLPIFCSDEKAPLNPIIVILHVGVQRSRALERRPQHVMLLQRSACILPMRDFLRAPSLMLPRER